MVDTQTVGQSPIIKRTIQLYLSVCQLAATMQTQLNYKEMQDIRLTFKDFRYCIYEMYYLLIDSYDFDQKLRGDLEKWGAVNMVSAKNEKDFYIESLGLFKFFKAELNRLSIISMEDQ